MSNFAFIPRSIKQRKVTASPVANLTPTPNPSTVSSLPWPALPKQTSDQAEEIRALPLGNESVKGKEKVSGEGVGRWGKSTVTELPKSKPTTKGPEPFELAILISLSLSDYALWADVDLRRKIDQGTNFEQQDRDDEMYVAHDNPEGDGESDDGGYIPLSYLFRHSSVFRLASSSPLYTNQPETSFVKALRAHASDKIDVRFIVSSDTTSVRAQASNWSKGGPPGYEVRRKDFAAMKTSDISRYSKADWDELTVYIENIPVSYRHIPGITRLTSTLLPPSISRASQRVQAISLPPHHQDIINAVPTCKGFALVTLSSKDDVTALLKTWPWDVPPSKRASGDNEVAPGEDDGEAGQVFREARKFGLRTISKSRWEELKAEYLLYRQQLVEEINQHQDKENALLRKDAQSSSDAATQPTARPYAGPSAEPVEQISALQKNHGQKTPQFHTNSRYPPGCLVFVRNLHPETNKTTLKSLFSQAWSGDAGTGTANGLDYVDYTKNMDVCHIRLSTPRHSEELVAYFSAHLLSQTSGLDGVGSSVGSTLSGSPSKPIELEMVLGKREEVYWEKVPEKVRRQAVDKAFTLIHGATTNAVDGSTAGAGPSGHRRKRRKV